MNNTAASRFPLASTILELLSSLLAPDLRADVLREALELEGSDTIPEDPERARAFVEGPLRLVVKRRVGVAMSNLLVQTLSPLFVSHADAFELPVIGEEDAPDDTDVYAPGHFERLRARVRSTEIPRAMEPATGPRRTAGQSGVMARVDRDDGDEQA